VIGFGDTTQIPDFTEMVGAHLEQQKISIRRSIENGQRKSNVIVEITRCAMNSIPRGKRCIQQVFISCFTIAPRNRHDSTIQPTSVFFGQFLHRSEDVFYVPVPMIVLFLNNIVSEYYSQGSSFQSFLRILT